MILFVTFAMCFHFACWFLMLFVCNSLVVVVFVLLLALLWYACILFAYGYLRVGCVHGLLAWIHGSFDLFFNIFCKDCFDCSCLVGLRDFGC